jgi:hypothetical protein
MTGPHLAGPAWTAEDDRKLLSMFQMGMGKPSIARKLKRTVAAIKSRRAKLRQLEREKRSGVEYASSDPVT